MSSSPMQSLCATPLLTSLTDAVGDFSSPGNPIYSPRADESGRGLRTNRGSSMPGLSCGGARSGSVRGGSSDTMRYDKCRCKVSVCLSPSGSASSASTRSGDALVKPTRRNYFARRFNKSFCFSVLGIQFFAMLIVYLAFLFFWFVDSTLLEDEFLLFVDTSTDTVYQVDKNGNNLFKIELPASVRLATPRGLHYDPLEKKIYIADNEARRIVRCNLNGTDAETLFYLPAVSRPEGIAVDATAKLFFYTDTGTDSIMVSNFHGNVTKTIFRSAHQPRSIRVDTVNRHLYWTDWGKKAVYRSNYNGQEISKYLNPESNSKLAAVTLDNNERKVYWVDSGLSTIKMAAMPPAVRPGVLPSGSDTEAPAPSSAQLTFDILLSHNISEEVIMYGLASHEKYLYYYINRDGASTINRFNKETNTTIQFLDLDSINVGPEVYEMLYYDSTEQLNNATDNGCMVPPGGSDDDANGGCSHLCLPLAQSSICACPDDRRLESDGHTCTTELTFQGPELIWLEFDGMFMGYIRGAIGDPTDFLNTGPLLSWTVRSDRWHFTAADIDYENSRLVMFDRFDRLLVYLTLAGQKRISHLSYGMSTEVYGLAVDWRSRNIYWTDALYNWIMVTKMSDSINDDTRAAPPSKIIYRHLERPHGIALYPSKGILVWSDWGSDPRIEIGSLDGSEDSRRVLVNSRLNNPKGLTIDYATDTLFWVNHDTIEAIQLDGSNRRFLGSQYGNNYQAIAVFGNYLMATDLGQGSATYPRALWFYRIDAPGAVGQRLPLRRRPYSVMMYDESRQPGGSTDAPCQQLSCEHLCVSSANDTAMCLCKDDYHMVNETCVLNELQQQPMYIYALSNSLCDIEAKYSSSSFHNAPHNCFYSESDKRYRSLAYDYNSGAIYFSSATSDGTYSIEQTSVIANEQSYELITNTGEIQGIALDWVIGNLYWCDVTYNQIWMSSNDGRIQTILYTTENGTTPTAVTVDPIACKLYWIETDTQNNSQIIRANLDGSSREVFVEDDLVGPSGLAISYKNERLYFTNTDHEINGKKLEYVHLTGQNRAAQPVPFHIDYQPFDVDVLQDYVVFTDTQETQAGIRVVELGRGSDLNPQLIQQGQNESYDVLAYDSHNQPALPVGEHVGCGNNSCDEFCFNVQGDDLTYNCGCIVGKQLNVNGISCDIVSDLANTTTYILAMDEHLHGIYKINLNNNIQSSYSALGATPYDAPGAITWDGSNNTLYWTDKDAGNIKSAIYSGNDDLFVNILHNPEDGSNINGLFYDRASKLIYFTDATRNAISVIHELGGIKVIWDAEDNPDNAALVTGALAVDSQEGKLYFALGADIYRIHSNGEGDLALCNSDGGDGGGVVTTLAIDKQANALYWSTQGSNVIKKLSLVDLDDDSQTATPETISLGENASPKSFALSADKIFWSDVNQKGLFSIPRDSTSQDGVERWSDQVFRGLTTLIYVDTEEAVNSACGTNNGGCQEMCFPTINGISCGCSGGLTASPDTGICTDVVCSDDIPGGSWDSSCGREAFEFCAWSCDEGKVVASGPHHIICLAEHWSVNLDVLCTDPPSTCAPVLVGPNATVHCDNHANVSSQCTVTCDSGFEPQTPQTITCQESLLWSADLTECTPIPVTCRPPHMTSFTTRYTCDRHYNVGSQCTMSCIPGYVIPPNTPSHIMTCHVTGQWIGAEPFHCIRPVVTQPTPAPTSAHAGTSAATTSGMAASTAAQSPATSPRATPTPETATEKHSNFKDPTDDGSGKKNGLLIGMVLLAVVLVVIIIIIGFIAYRRSRSRGARYQRSEFMNDSVDYAAGEATPVYDSATGSVKLDNDTLTFDNPGYLSLSEQNGMNSDEMEPVTLKDSFDTPFESQNGAASQRTDANKNFENPLYINPQESDDTPEDFNQVRLVVE